MPIPREGYLRRESGIDIGCFESEYVQQCIQYARVELTNAGFHARHGDLNLRGAGPAGDNRDIAGGCMKHEGAGSVAFREDDGCRHACMTAERDLGRR